MCAMLLAENINKSFRQKSGQPVTALESVSFEVRPGGLTALVGPDGAGKTTLLRIVAGLLCPDAGRLEFEGKELAARSEDIQTRIGYMPQKFGLYEDLTVQENLDLYADLKGVGHEEREGIFTPGEHPATAADIHIHKYRKFSEIFSTMLCTVQILLHIFALTNKMQNRIL